MVWAQALVTEILFVLTYKATVIRIFPRHLHVSNKTAAANPDEIEQGSQPADQCIQVHPYLLLGGGKRDGSELACTAPYLRYLHRGPRRPR